MALTKRGRTLDVIILLDQDGVLADFDSGFLRRWRARYPNAPFVPRAKRKNYQTYLDYPKELWPRVRRVCRAPGFFRDLPAVPGAVGAVKEIIALGHEVFICTTPMIPYHLCASEKYQWVEKHFGADLAKKIILTCDKTIVRGAMLIDDKPEIIGAVQPVWERVVFDQPYNRHVKGPIRINWFNWRARLPCLLQ